MRSRRSLGIWALAVALGGGSTLAVPSSEAHRRLPHACLDPDGCDIPWAWDDNRLAPPPAPSFPQGFALTVQMPPAGTTSAAPPRIERYPQVAEALARCWHPSEDVGDHHWGAITLRLSFRRDGSVIGTPRITYVDKLVDKSIDVKLKRSLAAALLRCTPLPFTPSLGAAIAGQIFSIRFIQQGLAI